MGEWRRARTARLWLDAAVEDDVDDLHTIHADPATWSHFPSGRHMTRAQSAAMVAGDEARWTEHGLGYWSVRTVDGGPVVGRGGCSVPAWCPWWNLYYRLSPAVHARGYATELAATALKAAHAVDPDRPVIAYLLEHNVASRRTAERVGLRLAWRGPDLGNPDPDAVRLVFADREPDASLASAIRLHCEHPASRDPV